MVEACPRGCGAPYNTTDGTETACLAASTELSRSH